MAAAMAINKKAIVDRLLRGYGEPIDTLQAPTGHLALWYHFDYLQLFEALVFIHFFNQTVSTVRLNIHIHQQDMKWHFFFRRCFQRCIGNSRIK